MQTLVGRGFLYQCTDEAGLDKLATSDNLVGYIGFDCTAPSLHVGSLVQIMMLRHLQQSGGTPIVLLGGGTTKIGDPSGKDKSRQMLTQEKIDSNKDGIRRVFATAGGTPTPGRTPRGVAVTSNFYVWSELNLPSTVWSRWKRSNAVSRTNSQ